MKKFALKIKLSRTQMIAVSFLGIIVAGTLLLMLPFSTRAGQQTGFLDALFTAASSTCVCGLVVFDTWTHWTLFGQLVILTMIQIGGLGFITLSVFMMILLRKKIGLNRRELIRESFGSLQMAGSVKFLRRIVFGTLAVEGTGALLLAFRFIPDFGWLKGIYYSVFHSVSAFCNAGFDLMGTVEPYSSFCGYYDDTLVNTVVMALIVVSGLGFLVWDDVLTNGLKFKKYMLHSKIVLTTTLVLIFGGAFVFWICERNNILAGMSGKEQFLCSMFLSISPRTAGMNTVDIAGLTDASKILTAVYSFIGGSPGSTAGGIKTTTIIVILVYIKSYIRSEQGCRIFGRRLEKDVINKACIVVFINFILSMTALMAILMIQELPMSDIIVEVFSAIGTVGISTGVTRDLNSASRIIIILLMYCGRVGSLTFALSFSERRKSAKIDYPVEQITVG